MKNKLEKNKFTKDVKVKEIKRDYSVQAKIRHEVDKNPGLWTNRLLVATPSTGLVRMEWVLAKYSQVLPTNWSTVEMQQSLNPYVPMEYVLPDAENLIAKEMVEGNYEWMLMIEEDNILPQGAYLKLNEYMTDKKVPIVSGLYFTKSEPPEPIVYRGSGNGAFRDFKLGDKLWADGIPFGFTLIHGSIIRALWNESEEYMVGNQLTRKVFSLPDMNVGAPGEGRFAATRGTTDLAFCKRIMKDKIFEKAGWPKFQKMKYPFLCDTDIFIKHIDRNGQMFPITLPKRYEPNAKRGKKTIK